MSSATPVVLIHPQIREAVVAAFEEREGWQAKIAAAARQLPAEGPELESGSDGRALLRNSAAMHVHAAIEHLTRACVLNQSLMGVLGAQFEEMPESHDKHSKEIEAAIETPPELALQDALDEALETLRSAHKRYTE